jgi:hypothetical protein
LEPERLKVDLLFSVTVRPVKNPFMYYPSNPDLPQICIVQRKEESCSGIEKNLTGSIAGRIEHYLPYHL